MAGIIGVMTQSLSDILANKWEEPPEIKIIKDYVQKHFDANVSVGIGEKQINIIVASSALAATLRMQIYDLQKAVGGNKRLVIRIGQ